MASWSSDPNEPGEGAGKVEADAPAAGARRSILTLRVLLTGVVLLAGLAVASPVKKVVDAAGEVACSAAPIGASDQLQVLVLPPGHPPIPGLQAQGQVIGVLPPGHPPIDQLLRAPPVPARPLSPVFQAPATVDL